MMQKPTYVPGQEVSLPVDTWQGLALILWAEDEELSRYLLDEIAETKSGMHTVYGLTWNEISSIVMACSKCIAAFMED